MSTAAYSLDRNQFASGGRPPSIVYGYVDPDGEPVGAVARFESHGETPKTFLQFRFTGRGYAPGLNKTRLPLYRLPQVIAAAARGDVVYVPEGEQCVDFLVGLGLAATSNAGGAGKWSDADAAHLRGAHVVVLADSDAPGRKHADDVARSVHGVAASVRVLELPALNDGDDVVDWFGRGATVEELNRLKGSAPLWSSSRVSVAEWPTPTRFAVANEPEQFRAREVLPEFLAEYAESVASSIQVDVAGPGTVMPVVGSACAGNVFSVAVKPGYSEKNLSRYVVLGMASAERKSAFFAAVTEPLVLWEVQRQAAYKSALREFKKRDKEDESHAPPRAPRIIARDPTIPALVRLMHANGGSMSVMGADARSFVDTVLGQYRRDGGTDDALFLNAHGGDPVGRERIGVAAESEHLVIYHPHLAIAVCIQPDKIEQLAQRSDLMSSGFIPRANFVSPRSLVGSRFETGVDVIVPADQRRAYETILHALIEERFRIVDQQPSGLVESRQLTLGYEAREQWASYVNYIEERIGPEGPFAHVASIAGKAAGEAVRLAGTFHLLELARQGALSKAETTPISDSTWGLAERHQRWQFDETRRVLHLAIEAPIERRARELIAWAAKDESTRTIVDASDLVRAHKVKNVHEGDTLLRHLCERGWVRQAAPQSSKRSQSWQFHPSVFGESK